MHIALEGFLKGFGKIIKESTNLLEEVISHMKRNVHITNGETLFDTFVKDITLDPKMISVENGFLKIGKGAEKVTAEEFAYLLRRGDLKSLLKITGSTMEITASQVKAFERYVGHTPEMYAKQIEHISENASKSHPDLNAKTKNELSLSGEKKIEKIEKSFLKKFGGKTFIIGGVAVAAIGYGFIEKIMNEQEGAHLQTIDPITGNISKSCKIKEHTCNPNAQKYGNFCTYDDFHLSEDNSEIPVAIYVLDTLNNLQDNSIILKDYIQRFGFKDKDDAKKNVSKILSDKYDDVVAFFKETNHKNGSEFIRSPCRVGTAENFENNKLPTCRVYSPSASKTSTVFLHSNYLFNDPYKSLVCNHRRSYLEVISEITIATGHDLFKSVTNIFGQALKTIFKYSFILLFVISIILVIFYLVRSGIRNSRLEARNKTQLYSSATAYNLPSQYINSEFVSA